MHVSSAFERRWYLWHVYLELFFSKASFEIDCNGVGGGGEERARGKPFFFLFGACAHS